MIHITVAANAIHLEAGRRLLDGLRPRQTGLELLLWEPRRFRLTPADRRRWPWRLPVHPASYLLLAPWALLGLVRELRLAHRSGAGLGLRLLLRRAHRLTLLDDGLDQYRDQPRAVNPGAFSAGIDCWLFSDAPAWRAPWCHRFSCRELGPLYQLPDGPGGKEATVSPSTGTLILDSPGLEGLREQAAAFPHPWWLVPHPVEGKRSWPLPLDAVDRCQPVSAEEILPHWQGTVVVGESLLLLAALRLRGPGTRLVLALPPTADGRLRALVAAEAKRQPLIHVTGA